MKKNFRFLAMAVVAMAAAVFTGCSSDDDFLAPYEESAIQTRAISSTNALIDFDNVPSSVMAYPNGDWNQILSSREFQH